MSVFGSARTVFGRGMHASGKFLGGLTGKALGGIAHNARIVGSTMMNIPNGSLRDPKAVQQMANSSLKLYGAYTLATYGARGVQGRNMFRNNKGKRDILPMIPGL